MPKPVLVILAGGIGSRYGSLKQMEPVDEAGHWIIDFSVYDAKRAGFETVICVVSEGIEDDFKNRMNGRAGKHVDILYARQTIDMMPKGFAVPEGRTKPWGTAHAMISAKRFVEGPFAVINADDFYGPDAYRQIYAFLSDYKTGGNAMVGYRLKNTLTEHGYVSRGVCEIKNGTLAAVTERTRIEKRGVGAAYTEDGETYYDLSAEDVVSMNLWGFGPEFMDYAENEFAVFLNENIKANPLKCEYFLPSVVNKMITEGKGAVNVLFTGEKWLGVTYREDMPAVREEISKMKKRGEYPEALWN